MTTVRELAADLRRAGLAEVDDSIRRRAEYSTDASNYRVVPQVVAFPRSTDEVVAAVSPPASTASRSRPVAAGRPPPATRSAPGWCSTSHGT
jgi:FAD/FMN-containing dehydrogenase